MQVFLRGIPEGATFNIISFGTRFQLLFAKGSVPYGDKSLEEASNVRSVPQ
jgi:hypothetical protein